MTHPVAGTWKLPGAPFRPQLTPWQLRRPAPTLGQHTDALLSERLELTTGELQELRRENVI
jgi:crotonobetainyl-CoA:carnitine CoA-transferase CaiB-like acyl-CoA transferase